MSRPLRIRVLTVSDSRTLDTDTSGALLEERARGAGHQVDERRIEPDDRYRLDEKARRLVGQRRKLVFHMGDDVALEIRDCEPIRGSLVLQIVR